MGGWGQLGPRGDSIEGTTVVQAMLLGRRHRKQGLKHARWVLFADRARHLGRADEGWAVEAGAARRMEDD